MRKEKMAVNYETNFKIYLSRNTSLNKIKNALNELKLHVTIEALSTCEHFL